MISDILQAINEQAPEVLKEAQPGDECVFVLNNCAVVVGFDLKQDEDGTPVSKVQVFGGEPIRIDHDAQVFLEGKSE